MTVAVSRVAMVWLTIASLLSAAVATLGLGLSAMASDEVSRASEALHLQVLVSGWLAVSLAAPVVALFLAWRGNASAAYACYLPVLIIGAFAVWRLMTF